MFLCSPDSANCVCCAGSNEDEAKLHGVVQEENLSRTVTVMQPDDEDLFPPQGLKLAETVSAKAFQAYSDAEAQKTDALATEAWSPPTQPSAVSLLRDRSIADDVEEYEALPVAQGHGPGAPSTVSESLDYLQAKPRLLSEEMEGYDADRSSNPRVIQSSRSEGSSGEQAFMIAYLPKEIRGSVVLVQEEGDSWRLTNGHLQSSAPNGVAFRKSKNLTDKIQQDFAWGTVLNGYDENDGWVRFKVRKEKLNVYLPKIINGAIVLIAEESSKWRLTNENLQSLKTHGVAYRKSKKMTDKLGPETEDLLAWEEAVHGVDDGDGWVRCRVPKVRGK